MKKKDGLKILKSYRLEQILFLHIRRSLQEWLPMLVRSLLNSDN